MTPEQVLRRASDLFHEIGMALTADKLLGDARNTRNAVLAEKLRQDTRTPTQLQDLVTAGAALCASAADETPIARAYYLFHEITQGLRAGDASERVRSITADGFEVCIRALAAMGATDVTIHECGERSFEEHW